MSALVEALRAYDGTSPYTITLSAEDARWLVECMADDSAFGERRSVEDCIANAVDDCVRVARMRRAMAEAFTTAREAA